MNHVPVDTPAVAESGDANTAIVGDTLPVPEPECDTRELTTTGTDLDVPAATYSVCSLQSVLAHMINTLLTVQ